MRLSDKRTYAFNGNTTLEETTEYCYEEKYVKEFIKELKEKINNSLQLNGTHTHDVIDELAGEKLVGGEGK